MRCGASSGTTRPLQRPWAGFLFRRRSADRSEIHGTICHKASPQITTKFMWYTRNHHKINACGIKWYKQFPNGCFIFVLTTLDMVYLGCVTVI